MDQATYGGNTRLIGEAPTSASYLPHAICRQGSRRPEPRDFVQVFSS